MLSTLCVLPSCPLDVKAVYCVCFCLRTHCTPAIVLSLQPTFWSVVAICVAYHGWNIGVDLWRQWQLSLTPGELMSRSSKGLPDSYPAAPAAAAPVINAVITARPTAIVTGAHPLALKPLCTV